MMSKQCKPKPKRNCTKLPYLAVCPNPQCARTFSRSSSVAHHLQQSPTCAPFIVNYHPTAVSAPPGHDANGTDIDEETMQGVVYNMVEDTDEDDEVESVVSNESR